METYEYSFGFELGCLHIAPVHVRIEQLRPIIAADSHSNVSYEIHYTEQGRGTVTVDGQTYDVFPGRLYVTGPGVVHAQLSDPADPVVEYCLYLNCRQYLRASADPLALFVKTPFWMGVDGGRFFALVRQLVDEMHSCISGALRRISENSTTHLRIERMSEPATIEEIFAYYRSTLDRALVTYQAEVAKDEGGGRLQDEICEYINARVLSPDLSLTAVADHFGVSSKMVGTVCRERFGKTFLQYVRDCQIQHATRLLQTTDLSLEEISEQCGFTNLLTFRRNFKATMGINPSDYRKS